MVRIWLEPIGDEEPLAVDLMHLDVFGREDAPVLQAAPAKIDQQTARTGAHRQGTDHLRQVAVIQTSQRLDLHHHLFIHDEIGDEIANQLAFPQAVIYGKKPLRFIG